MRAIKNIIFDCFGVLYPVYIDNFFNAHKSLFTDGYKLLDKLNLQIDLGQITQADFFDAIEKEIHVPASKIQAEMEANLIIDRNLTKLIAQLKTSYKVGLLSNAGEEEIAVIYRDSVDMLFDAIAVSYEVGDVKPNSKIFYTCLNRLGARPEESLFIDDSKKNLIGAQNIGMQTLHYPKFGNIPTELHELAKNN